MRIVIATSKSWFPNSTDVNKFSDMEILWIKEREALVMEKLMEYKPDFIFFPHWNWKIDKEIYENFKSIVFHTAPLPFGRGGSPIQNLIIKGFKVSPVNAILVGAEIDAGDIIASKEVSLEGNLSDIFARISTIVADLILEILQGNAIPSPQIGIPVIFKRRTSADNIIPNSNIDLDGVYDRIRMLDAPDYPKASIQHGNLLIEFSDSRLLNGTLIAQATFKIDTPHV
jgi:methionyl-tRNA formyltransferase